MTDDLELVVSTPTETITRHELRRQFYRFHKFKTQDWNGNSIIEILKPRSTLTFSDLCRESICFGYYRGFFTEVTQGASILTGPHVVKLYARVQQENIWIGTTTIRCNYYDRKAIRKKLRRAIRDKEYFLSEDSGKDEFDITPPQEEIFREEKKFRAEYLVCPYCGKSRKTEKKMSTHTRLKHNRLSYYTKKGRMKVSQPLMHVSFKMSGDRTIKLTSLT